MKITDEQMDWQQHVANDPFAGGTLITTIEHDAEVAHRWISPHAGLGIRVAQRFAVIRRKWGHAPGETDCVGCWTYAFA